MRKAHLWICCRLCHFDRMPVVCSSHHMFCECKLTNDTTADATGVRFRIVSLVFRMKLTANIEISLNSYFGPSTLYLIVICKKIKKLLTK